MVDLPDPVPPTRATVSPGAMSRVTSVSVGVAASSKRKLTPRRLTAPRGSLIRLVPDTTVSGASNTSHTRSAAVWASRMKLRRNPSEPTGQASDSSSVTKETTWPSVRSPSAAATAAPPRTTTSSTDGNASSSVHSTAASRIRCTPESRRSMARRSKARNAWGTRPNERMTRTPWSASSAVEATSPVRSCTSRETIPKRRTR